MEADIEFVAPAQVEIDSYAANGLPVYVYSFNYLPESHIYEEVQLFSTIIFEKCFRRRKSTIYSEKTQLLC